MIIEEWGKDVVDFITKYWTILTGMFIFGIVWYFIFL